MREIGRAATGESIIFSWSRGCTPGMGASGDRGETRVGQEEGNWSYQFLVIQLASNLW